MLVLLLNKNLG